MKRELLPLALLVLVIAASGCIGESAQEISNDDLDAPHMDAPDFEMVNQDGEMVDMSDLRSRDGGNRTVITYFFYTSCTTVCPVLTVKMAAVQEELKDEGVFGDDVVIVGISVDPETDDTRRLKEYGEGHGIDFSGWHLLRPNSTQQRDVVVRGFGGLVDYNASTGVYIHTGSVFVVGPDGKIVYHSEPVVVSAPGGPPAHSFEPEKVATVAAEATG